MARFFLVFAISFLLSSCSSAPPEQAPREIPPVPVRVQSLDFQSVSEKFETAGELKAAKEVLLSAEASGMLEEILVREGNYVEKDVVLVRIKSSDLRADLKLAEADHKRYLELYSEGAISKQALDQAESKLERLQAELSKLEIRALFAGRVGQIYLDPGDYVQVGAKILDLVKINPLRVTYSIPEKLIPFVKISQRVEVKLAANSDKVLDASVDFISPRVDPQTRSVLIRARLLDTARNRRLKKSLKANQFVTVRQNFRNVKQALLAKEEAIYLDQGQQFIYLAQDGMAKRVAIRTGIREEGIVEIIPEEGEEISKGDLLVYSGLQKIYPGAQLMIID